MTLRLVYDDRQSTFEELFNKDKSVTNHHRNLQVLVIEWYKVYHGLAAELDIFIKKIDTIQHQNKKKLNLFIMAQKQYPFLAQKYENFCQVTLRSLIKY